jgi:hypothetical protein
MLAARICTTIATIIVPFFRHIQFTDIRRPCVTQQSVFMEKENITVLALE